MYQADTVKGAPDQIGEFSGNSTIDSNYTNLQDIEGDNNHYFVYRMWDTDGLTELYTQDKNTHINDTVSDTTKPVTIGETKFYCYSVLHMQHEKYGHEDLWNGAYQSTADKKALFSVNVYVSDAQADLMLGTPTSANESEPEGSGTETQDPCDVNGEHTIQKIWKDDNNSSGTRPGDVTVTVKQDGEIYDPVTENEKNPITMTDEMAGSDPDVWTTTIDAPIYETENDKYEYTVEETPILNAAGDQTYATIYKDLDEYTHQIINYLPAELVKEDTVVIDFGLSVDIDVLTNDTNVGGKLAGVNIKNTNTTEENSTEKFDTTLLNKVTNKLDDSFSSEAVWKETLGEGEEQTVVSGDYGTAQIKGDTIRFTPNTMAMDSWQEIMYAVQLPDNNGQHQYVYGMVTVVPATTIYYEDNSGAIHYQDGGYTTNKLTKEELAALTKDTDGWTSHGKWKTVGTESSDVQDTDRPGEAEIKNVIDNVYGNDTHYTNCSTYSNGSSHYVRVSAVNTYQNGGTSPRATFTFKGTGFDLISLTSRETGAVTIRVYKGTNSSGTKILDHTVDTYYGYKYTNGAWQKDPYSTDVLYQIPILKEEMEEYGQYYVEVIPMYSDAYDMYDDKYYDIYFDAVRIYDPAKPHENEYDKIGDAYRTDGENHPDYTEIRQILLNAENVGGEIPDGAVFVDGNGSVSDIKAYESFGPKNEVYLAPGQGISFYLWTNEKPDKVQLGAKLALGTDTKLAIATAVQEEDAGAENGGWNFYKVKDWDVSTSYDLYYEFTDNCEWQEVDGYMKYRTQYPIVIANPKRYYEDSELKENEAVLSLTNLQWTDARTRRPGDVDNQPTDDNLKNQPLQQK